MTNLIERIFLKSRKPYNRFIHEWLLLTVDDI